MHIVNGATWWLQIYRIVRNTHKSETFGDRNVIVRSVKGRKMSLSWFQQWKWKLGIPYRDLFWPWVSGDLLSLHSSGGLKSPELEHFRDIFAFFWKTTPYDKIFKILFGKFTSRNRSTLLCAKFVKIVRREIGESVRYLPDQKQTFFGFLSNCGYCADRAQSLPWPAPNIWLTTFQISSKSVHIRRTYSRPREDRSKCTIESY